MITYQRNQLLEPSNIAQVFDGSGIVRPTHDLKRIARMFDNANLVISAWDQSEFAEP